MKITRCKLLRKQQLRLLEYFVLEVTARSAADLLGIQPNSAALFYRKLREVIAYHLSQKEHEVFYGAVELDERYFGGVRKGKRGRSAAGKVAVFGILKRSGKVYTEPLQVLRRLFKMREYRNEEHKQIFPGSQRTRCAHGNGAA